MRKSFIYKEAVVFINYYEVYVLNLSKAIKQISTGKNANS